MGSEGEAHPPIETATPSNNCHHGAVKALRSTQLATNIGDESQAKRSDEQRVVRRKKR
jgi:hypothetical protein